MESIKIDIVKAAALVRACGKADPLAAIRGATNQAGRRLLRQSEDAAAVILQAAQEQLGSATSAVAELGAVVVPGWEVCSIGEKLTMLARISGGSEEVTALKAALKSLNAAKYIVKTLSA